MKQIEKVEPVCLEGLFSELSGLDIFVCKVKHKIKFFFLKMATNLKIIKPSLVRKE